MMKRQVLAAATISGLTLAACSDPQAQREAEFAGFLGGLGLITAVMLDADPEWVAVATVAGATAGALVARNSAKNECAYANGDGTYRREAC